MLADNTDKWLNFLTYFSENFWKIDDFLTVCLQTWNQSMVQQLMSDGNMRSRLRKASPIGLMASTMCRFCLTRSINMLYIASGVTSILRPCSQHRGISAMWPSDTVYMIFTNISYLIDWSVNASRKLECPATRLVSAGDETQRTDRSWGSNTKCCINSGMHQPFHNMIQWCKHNRLTCN